MALDEFICQYQVFCTCRSKVTKTQDELIMSSESAPVRVGLCCVYHLLTIFQGLELIRCVEHRLSSDAKSRVNDCIIALREGKSLTLGQCFLYRMLSYFDITGLLRVHVHRGDFALGLKVTENVDLNQKVSLDSPL